MKKLLCLLSLFPALALAASPTFENLTITGTLSAPGGVISGAHSGTSSGLNTGDQTLSSITGTLAAANGGTGATALGPALSVSSGTLTIADSGTATSGKVRLATPTETQTGTSGTTATTPEGITAWGTWMDTQSRAIAGNRTFSGTTAISLATVTTGTVGTLVVTGTTRTDGNFIGGDASGDTATLNWGSALAPNLTANAATGMMTRAMTDVNPMWALWNIRPIVAVSYGASGTGSTGAASPNLLGVVSCGTSTSGYGRMSIARGLTSVTSFTGGGINFSVPLSVGWIGALNISGTTHCARIVVGGNGGVPATADANALTVRGFGVEFGWQNSRIECRLFAHDGTTYSTSAWNGAAIGAYSGLTSVVLKSNGAGTIYLYASNSGRPSLTPTLTLTGGPTATGGEYVDIVAVATATGSPTNAGLGTIAGWVGIE